MVFAGDTPAYVFDIVLGFLAGLLALPVCWVAIRILAPLLGFGGRKVPEEELMSILAITNASLASGEPTLPQ